MSDNWFYADGRESIGPLSLRHLLVLLHKMPNAKDVEVWNESLENWRPAKSVPEIASALFPASKQQLVPPSRKQHAAASPAKTNLRRAVSIGLAATLALSVIAALTTLIFGNSAEGIAHVCGEFIGALILCSLIAIPWRKSPYAPAIVLLVATATTLSSNQQHIFDAFTVRDAQAVLKDIRSPSQLDEALARSPQNVFLKVLAEAAKLGQESDRRGQALMAQVEPAELNQDINVASATRDELTKYVRALKTAEENANAVVPKILAIQQDEREKLERYARSMNFSEVSSLLSGVDKRNAKAEEFSSRMMKGQADAYRCWADALTILVEEYGRYTVEPSGQIRFSDGSAASRYNNASKALSDANKRLSALEAERKELVQAQQAGWERFVSQGMPSR